MSGPAIEPSCLSDGYQAFGRWWRPEPARGAVLYLHGIQSHGGWYEESGGILADGGHTVFMPDRRGSGLNSRDRGHVESVERAVEDARDSLEELLRATGRSSAHVVGVSWGGKLAVCLAAAAPDAVASLTLVAPGLFPVVDLSPPEKFRVAVSLINHRTKLFDIPLNEPAFFTDNPTRVEFVKNDALMLRQVTAPFLLATRRMDRIVGRLGSSGYCRPVHLMLAGRDRIIDNARSRKWLKGLGRSTQRLTEYPQAQHTLEFERAPSSFLDDLIGGIREFDDEVGGG